ncbi:MAG: hypothetical protein PUD25_02455 [Bacilli bacterium]|nr:hypothetical protein [Bacilli bacterium]
MNLKKSIQFTNDLRQVFIDYVFVLDDYFEVESNINEHNELYLEYENLRKNIENLMIKYDLDKEIKK